MSGAAAPSLAVVGAGRAGTALGVLLARAGWTVAAASGRDATRRRLAHHLSDVPLRSATEAAAAGDVVLIAVPDDRIAPICEEIARGAAFRDGQSVVHLSGSVGLDALTPAADAGARVLSIHPLQTFPDVESALERLPGSAFAVTALDEPGLAFGEDLVRAVGGRPFRLSDDRKPLYHAAAVFCSNYLAVVEGIAEELFRRSGLDDPLALFMPLAEATLANVGRVGPAAALTGPAVRGDAGTIRRNLEALRDDAPEAVPAYVALARAALDLARDRGSIDPAAAERVEEVLAAWT